MDCLHTGGSPRITLWRNERKDLSPSHCEINWVRGWGVAAIDYDNDGWIDLVTASETADGKGEIRLFRNLN